LVYFNIRGIEEGDTDIVVYCKLPESEYMKSIAVKIGSNEDNTSLSKNNKPSKPMEPNLKEDGSSKPIE
jgi:hypothetical protein